MNWTGRRVLVTGGAGFIGSHLVEALLERGAQVTAFVRYTSRSSIGFLASLGGSVGVVTGDLSEFDSVQGAMRNQEYVFHLGALIGIPYSFVHPREVVSVNTIGTLNVLTAARDTKPARVILTSTSEVYGTARYVPMDEEHPLQAQSPYAASKIAADKLGESFFHAYQVPLSIVRPFNTFGPRQSMRAVIPTIIVQALKSSRVRLGATAPTRDFTFVKDTAQGFVRVAEVEAAIGEVVNLGTGREISVNDLASRIASLVGRDVQVITDEQRLRPGTSEIQRLCCNPAKAKRLTGWEARHSLDEGLLQTIDWLRQSHDIAEPERYQV
jgi:dTDP-glucose 4,6-dehydratase